MTPIKAIRAKCLDCCCDQANEVRMCPAETCPLYPFRLGHNPNLRREVSDEEREKLAERLRRVREGQKH